MTEVEVKKSPEAVLAGLRQQFSNTKAKSFNVSNISYLLKKITSSFNSKLSLEIKNLVVSFAGYELFVLKDTNAVHYNAYSVVRDLINYFEILPENVSRSYVEKIIVFH